jgi:hypothetical protein
MDIKVTSDQCRVKGCASRDSISDREMRVAAIDALDQGMRLLLEM